MFTKSLSKAIYEAAGWTLKGNIPSDIRKCVLVAAPHTSNWDFIYARAAFYLMGLKLRFTIKKEFMKFPFGPLLKSMGALPIDRSNTNNSMVQSMIDIINNEEEIVMLVTPEGTRKYQPRWRKGFYYAAVGANVPIVLGYLNYEKKEAGIGPVIYPSGDIEADIEKIKDFYRRIPAKFPEQGVK